MTFVSAITTCLRKYAVFRGRATRAEFWWWALAVFIVSIVLTSIIDGVISAVTGGRVEEVLSGIFFLAVLLPNLAVTVRRLHDIGKTGWWLLLWIVAGIGPWIALVGLVMVAVWGSLVAAGSAPGPAEFFFELLTGLALIWILAMLGLILRHPDQPCHSCMGDSLAGPAG